MTPKFKEHKKVVQYDLLSEILAEGAQRVGKYGFPQLEQQEYIPEENPLPINYLLSSTDRSSHWFHCFVEDSQFERLWHNYFKYVPIVCEAAGIIGTDFSLYRDYEEDILIRNCLRNRTLAYAYQKLGLKVIPTAGFAGENTWGWCYDGLPSESSIAITTNGTLSDPEARRLFVGGLDALVVLKRPKNLIICGHYPDWITQKYPNTNIVSIPSYSQMWRRRVR